MKDQRNYYFDIFRASAALAVFWAHLAGFTLAPISQYPSLIEKALNASTGYGHQAVMVFFVLSGYLISRGIWEKRFNWDAGDYISKRLTRLWIVLIPCLILTLLWNLVGMQDDSSGYYQGHLNHIYKGSRTTVIDLSFYTFLGNLFFVQTIFTKIYGDNEVLWSLANEFWYYLLFPSIVFTFYARTIIRRILCGFFAVLILVLLPTSIQYGFIVWLIGFGVYLIHKSLFNKYFVSRKFFVGSVLQFFATLQVTHSISLPENAKDLFVGLSFGLCVLACLNRRELPRVLKTPVSFASDMSYTLYLAHFPVMTYYVTKFLKNTQLPRTLGSIPQVLVVAVVIITYCALIYLIFERHTDKVRKWILTLVRRKPQ